MNWFKRKARRPVKIASRTLGRITTIEGARQSSSHVPLDEARVQLGVSGGDKVRICETCGSLVDSLTLKHETIELGGAMRPGRSIVILEPCGHAERRPDAG